MESYQIAVTVIGIVFILVILGALVLFWPKFLSWYYAARTRQLANKSAAEAAALRVKQEEARLRSERLVTEAKVHELETQAHLAARKAKDVRRGLDLEQSRLEADLASVQERLRVATLENETLTSKVSALTKSLDQSTLARDAEESNTQRIIAENESLIAENKKLKADLVKSADTIRHRDEDLQRIRNERAALKQLLDERSRNG
jgi:predicted DNA binding CopG/RHH family protein